MATTSGAADQWESNDFTEPFPSFSTDDSHVSLFLFYFYLSFLLFITLLLYFLLFIILLFTFLLFIFFTYEYFYTYIILMNIEVRV